jgi:hypothetical protein
MTGSIKKEYVSAFMVGVNQTIIGLPFDTVKVWMQNYQPVWGRPFTHYYKGALPEFTVAITANCMVFPIHSYTLPYTNNSFLSGAIAGMSISPLVYSFRVYKIYQQMSYNVSLDLLLRNKGRGYIPALGREMLGFSMYFGMYNYMRDHNLPVFLSGACAGLFNWGTSYPLDTIMSRQIAQNISIVDAFKHGNLYRGYGVCLLRSMIVNGCSFFVYETVRKLFE